MAINQVTINGAKVITYPPLASEIGVLDTHYPYGDVRRFGAAGDGTTDDTTAIQNAINTAALNGAGTGGSPLTYTTIPVYFARGLYRVSASLVIPSCIGFAMVGEGAPNGQTMSALQWIGTDQPAAYMVDARSVLGFVLKNLFFIGQSNLAVDASNCCGNGIFTRRYLSGNFNSYNDWQNVSCYRFPGVGITIGGYVGWNGSSYPADTGQTDNSTFANIMCADCRVGIVLNTPNFLSSLFTRLFIFNYGGNPVDGGGVPIADPNAAPVKFRTKNAVQILYGQFHVVSANLYASYADTDAWSQYAIYCQDGSFTLHGGYTETRYYAYVANGANGTGSANWNNFNAIRDVSLLPGAAGGPVTVGKHQINYNQTLLPLRVSGLGWSDILESAPCAGVFVEGKTRIVELTNVVRNLTEVESGTLYVGDATNGAVFLELPQNPAIGTTYTGRNNAGVNNVVMEAAAGNTINGAGSFSITPGQARTAIFHTGGKWVITSGVG